MKNMIIGGLAAISAILLILTFFVSVPSPEWETRTLNEDHGKFVAAESTSSETFLFYTNSSEGEVIAESAKTSGYLPALIEVIGGKTWKKTLIDSDEGTGAYLSAASTGGKVFAGYQDDSPGNERVVIASKEDGWNTTTVDSVGNSGINVGMHTSITTYKQNPFLIYHSPREGLITARKTTNGWDRTSRKKDLGRLTSSSSCGNKVKAGYVGRDTDKIRLATYNGEWTKSNLSEKARSSLSTDTRNCKLHMIYLDSDDGNIKYRSPDAEISEINNSEYTRLDIEADKKIRISYQNYGNGLYYAEKTENGWNRTLIDPDSSAGRYNDLEVDNAGNLHLIYSNGETVEHAVLNSGNYRIKKDLFNGFRIAVLLIGIIPTILLREQIINFLAEALPNKLD